MTSKNFIKFFKTNFESIQEIKELVAKLFSKIPKDTEIVSNLFNSLKKIFGLF